MDLNLSLHRPDVDNHRARTNSLNSACQATFTTTGRNRAMRAGTAKRAENSTIRRSMPLSRRLMLTLAVMFVPLLAVASSRLITFQSSVRSLDEFRAQADVESQLIDRVRILLESADDIGEDYVEQGDARMGERFLDTHDEIDQIFSRLGTLGSVRARGLTTSASALWEEAHKALHVAKGLPADSDGERLDLFHELIDEAGATVEDAYALNVNELSSEISTIQDRERTQMWLAFIIFCLSSIAVGLYIRRVHRSITTPLVALQKAAVEFGSDDLSHRIEVTGDDELARVSLAFNEMAGQLQRSKDHLAGAVSRDMAEWKQMERDLRASEELFRNAFVAGKGGMALIGTDQHYLQVNDSLCEMVGYTREELLSMGWMRLTHPDDLEANVDLTQQLLDGDASSYHVTKRYIHKDGRVIWVEISDAVFRGSEGDALYTVSQIQDVTDRKTAQATLEENEKLLKGILDNSPSSIYIKKIDGTYLVASKALLDGMALDAADVIGKTDLEIFPAEVAKHWIDADQRVFRTKKPVEAEDTAPHRDGSIHIYRSLKFPLFDQAEECYGLCGVSEDITHQSRALEDRQKLEATLRQAQKMEAVGQLAGGIAHDFNNILAVILNYAEFVTADLESYDPRLGDVQEIIKAGERATQLVHQLLAFSRQEVVEPKVLNLNGVITGLHNLLRSSIGEDIELVFEPALGLPNVFVDHSQLEQVVLNLTVNARDAMPNGGVLSIATSVQDLGNDDRVGLASGSYVRLSVTDTGKGMDPETIDRIFEPFFTTKPRGEGTGLGLATVYGIVKQSGGEVYVDSTSGRGSSMSVYLPVTLQVADRGVEPSKTPAKASGSETILVVEDERGVREVVSRILIKNGYLVVALPNGAEALAFCEKNVNDVDLLLTDVVMPEMSGKALVDAVLNLRADMKTIFMSGYTDEIIAQRGVLGEGEHLIMKPFKANELVRKVRSVLGADQR